MINHLRIATFCVFSVLCGKISSQNTITENNNNCIGTDALPLPFGTTITGYPHLFYDINPYASGTVTYNNAAYDLVFSNEFNGITTDLLTDWLSILNNRGCKVNKIDDNGNTVPSGVISYAYNLADPNQTTVEVSGGTLKLWAREEPGQIFKVFDWKSETDLLDDGYPNARQFDYTHGQIVTQRAFKHGYFEARIKIPVIDMVWPAFWMFHTEAGRRTEIDIFEFNMSDIYNNNCNIIQGEDQTTAFENANASMYMTYHDWWFSNSDLELCHSKTAKAQDNFSFVNQWHTYGLYWDEYKMIWFLDGTPLWYVFKYYNYGTFDYNAGIWDYIELINAIYGQNIAPKTNLGFPTDHSAIIFDMPVQNFGGLYDPNNDLSCTTPSGSLPKAMEVDYLRVFANRSCDAVYLNCNENHLPSNIAAEKIVIPDPSANNCEIVVQNPRQDAIAWGDFSNAQKIDMVANDFIRLTPGFRTEKGITLSARIDNCANADLRNSVDSSSLYVNSLLAKAYEKFKGDKAKGGENEITKTPVFEETFLEIFPNPSLGNFAIRLGEELTKEIEKHIEILTIDGKLAYKKSYYNDFESTLFLQAQLEEGLYFLKITAGNNSVIHKIIITAEER